MFPAGGLKAGRFIGVARGRGGRIPVLVLHWPAVWPLFRWKSATFNLFALTIGAMIPDIECPFVYLVVWDKWKARWVMHSLLGAATVDLVLTVLLVLYFVPWFLKYLDGKVKNKKYFKFAGTDLRAHTTKMGAIVGSTLVGTYSHVLIDVLHHPYNPLTFPFAQYYGFNLVLFNDLTLSGIIVQGGMLILLIMMLYLWYFRELMREVRGR